MNATYLSILMISVSLCGLLGAYFWLALSTSEKDTYATEIKPDRFKFIVKGDNLLKVIYNLRDAYLDSKDQVVTKGPRKIMYWNPLNWALLEFFGVYFVSILYPLREIYSFKIFNIHRYDPRAEGVLKNTVQIQDVKEDVKEFYRYLTHPVYLELLLGKDGSVVDVVVMLEGETIDPIMPVMSLNGNFLDRLEAGSKGAIEDWANGMSLEKIRLEKTGKGSSLSDAVKAIADALILSCGIRINDAYIEAMRPHGALGEKTQDVAIARIDAEALGIKTEADVKRIVNLAEAQKKADELEAAGKTARFLEPIKALISRKIGVTPDVAAVVVGKDIETDNLTQSDSKITTLAQGGSTTPIAITPTSTKP